MISPRRVVRWAMVAACLAGPSASPASEEEPAETIRVEGEPGTAPVDRTVFSTTIRAADHADRITSIEDLLQETVGLRVRSFGGLGSFATVSIRGSTAEQVDIYIDGIKLNHALGGGVNLADLSLGSVESIEIYRGFTPAHLESGAIGGAIDIRTRRPREEGTGVTGSLSIGSYNTAEASASASWAGDGNRPIDGLVAFTGRRTSGDFTYFDNNGTPFEGGDDGFETRANNRFWDGDLLGRTSIGLKSGGRIDLQASGARRRQGVPGIDSFQSETARSESDRSLFKAGISGLEGAEGALRFEANAHYSRSAQEFSDRFGDTTGRSTDTRLLTQAAGPLVALRWNARDGFWRSHFVDFMVAARLETADRTDRLNPVPDRGRSTRMTYNLSAQDEIHMAGGRLIVSPSVRWTRYHGTFEAEEVVAPPPSAVEEDEQLQGRLGFAWFLRSNVTLRGNAGRFYRLPTFTEIFGDQGTVRGSDDLAPEEGLNADLGISWDLRPRPDLERASLEIVLFLTEADNLIHYVQTSQSQVTARNTGQARISGAELSAGLGLLGWFEGSLNYTFQIPEDRSGTATHGTDLPGRPRHELSARAVAEIASGRGGRVFYDFDAIGAYYFDQAAAVLAGTSGLDRDQLRVPERYLHGAGYSREAGHLVFTVEVDNLFDVKTVDVVRYPLPGRMVQAKVRFEIP